MEYLADTKNEFWQDSSLLRIIRQQVIDFN